MKGTQEKGAHHMFDRAAIGYSLLVKNGFKNIINYSEGMNEWIQKGNPVVS
jgi:hydroxyacylglutathione hydrolase